MSISKETFYKLVKITELSTLNRNSFIQIIGKIILFDETNNRLQIDDTFGQLTIEIGKNKDFTAKKGQVIRVYGTFDGIKMSIEKIIDWSIEPEKIPILFSGL